MQSYLGLMKGFVDGYNAVDAMPDNLPSVMYPRTAGRFPTAEENPRNAWYVKTSIKGAASGKLAGKKIVAKDNIMVAGVPMMNGCSILEGYVPDIDATVIARILDAGGEIVGKAHCESYCISGGSHTGAKGPVHPQLHNPSHTFVGYAFCFSVSDNKEQIAFGDWLKPLPFFPFEAELFFRALPNFLRLVFPPNNFYLLLYISTESDAGQKDGQI